MLIIQNHNKEKTAEQAWSALNHIEHFAKSLDCYCPIKSNISGIEKWQVSISAFLQFFDCRSEISMNLLLSGWRIELFLSHTKPPLAIFLHKFYSKRTMMKNAFCQALNARTIEIPQHTWILSIITVLRFTMSASTWQWSFRDKMHCHDRLNFYRP